MRSPELLYDRAAVGLSPRALIVVSACSLVRRAARVRAARFSSYFLVSVRIWHWVAVVLMPHVPWLHACTGWLLSMPHVLAVVGLGCYVDGFIAKHPSERACLFARFRFSHPPGPGVELPLVP